MSKLPKPTLSKPESAPLSAPTTETLPKSTTPEQAGQEQVYNQLARAAYSAYGASVDYKNYRGESMPLYDELPVAIRKAWDNVVREIVAQLP